MERVPVEVTRPELLYVYEVDAEEVVYADSDVPPEIPEDGDAEVVSVDDMPPIEICEDEALPFEVRASAAGRDASAEANSAASPREESPDESSSDVVRPQTRLPGL